MHQVSLEMSREQARLFDAVFYRFIETTCGADADTFVKLESIQTRSGERRAASFDCPHSHSMFVAACEASLPFALIQQEVRYGLA